jgi:glycosyltransferase involved in cell wall biosynthesis
MTQKTILFAGHGSGLNGAERCMNETAAALVRLGYRVHVLLPSTGPLLPLLQKSGVTAVHVGSIPWWIDLGTRYGWLDKLKRLLRIGMSAIQTAALLRKLKPEIVISNTIAIPTPALAAFLLGIPHVWYVHELGREDHGYHFLFSEAVSTRLISFLSSLVLVNSRSVATKFSKAVPASKLRLIPYAVNVPQKFAQYREDLRKTGSYSLIIAGRVTPAKGQLQAVQAASLLIRHHKIKDFKLMILGAQPGDVHVRDIEAFVEAEHLRTHVEILPFSAAPLELIRSCDVLLMCSRYEAFGRVTVEAMKLGLAVVGSNTGGTLDIVQHDVNGLLYEAGDVQDLARKIAEILLDPIKRMRLSLNATMHANKTFSEYTHERAIDEALQFALSPPQAREVGSTRGAQKGAHEAGTPETSSNNPRSRGVAIQN